MDEKHAVAAAFRDSNGKRGDPVGMQEPQGTQKDPKDPSAP